jgi:hypothetical protein
MSALGKVFSWFFSIYSSVMLGTLLFLSYTENKRYQIAALASFIMLLIVFPPLWSFVDRKYNVRINWLVEFILLIFSYGFVLACVNAIG